MSFRLVDTGWDKELETALVADHSTVRIVCPFIKRRTAERLLRQGKPGALQVITRFNLDDFGAGVSDLSALRLLLDSGAQIRGMRNLHAKLYLLGATRAIVTSANLTEAAMLRNHELGFVAETPEVVGACRQYFDGLWSRAGQNLQRSRLEQWESKVGAYLAGGARPLAASGLGDEGMDGGIAPAPIVTPVWAGEAEQGFVKLLGEGDNRAGRSMKVLEEVIRSGCHWACAYPKGKRPRRVHDGALLFLGRLVKDPNDVLIFGRALGMHHEPGRDDATPADISRHSWKKQWPHYVRVSHAELVDGTLSNGVSLNALMTELAANSFAPTQRNARAGKGNTNPQHSLRQQADVELSPEGIAWVTEHLERAFARHGKIPAPALAELDWPTLP
jgi:hypothetical protein